MIPDTLVGQGGEKDSLTVKGEGGGPRGGKDENKRELPRKMVFEINARVRGNSGPGERR